MVGARPRNVGAERETCHEPELRRLAGEFDGGRVRASGVRNDSRAFRSARRRRRRVPCARSRDDIPQPDGAVEISLSASVLSADVSLEAGTRPIFLGDIRQLGRNCLRGNPGFSCRQSLELGPGQHRKDIGERSDVVTPATVRPVTEGTQIQSINVVVPGLLVVRLGK